MVGYYNKTQFSVQFAFVCALNGTMNYYDVIIKTCIVCGVHVHGFQSLLSHYMCPLLPNNAHLVNHIPVLETVFDESTIKRILILSICCSKVTVAPIIGSLVSCKIEDNCIQLKEKNKFSNHCTYFKVSLAH